MNRPPLFSNSSLLPTNPINLPQQQLNGKQSNQQMNPPQQLKPHPLLPLPPVNAPVVRPMTNTQLAMSFANRQPQPLNHPLLTKHPNLPPNRLPLVTQQPPAALLARLPNPQLLQNPPNPALLPPVSQARPHLINPSIKPPHLLQTPLITNPLISSNPLVPQTIAQNGIQNSSLISNASNEQIGTNVNKSPANDQQHSPLNGQHNADNENEQQDANQISENSEVWIETKTNDGKVYFYNSKTRETSWNKPENCKIITHEQFMQQQQLTHIKTTNEIKPQENSFPHQIPFQPMPGVIPPFAQFPMHPQLMMPPMMANIAISPQNMFMIPPEIRMAAIEWIEYKTPQGKPYYFSTKTQQSVWDKPKALIDLEQAMNKLKNEQNQPKNTSQNKEEKKVDKNKPVSSTPISGTPWCLVKTGDDRIFFFNPSTKTSVWQRPKDLDNNEEVDRLLNGDESTKKENDVKQEQKVSSASNQARDANQHEQTMTQSETNQNSVLADEESNSSSVNTDSNKDDLNATADNNKRNLEEDERSNKKVKITEEDSRKQMGITSIEAIASKQREQIPLEERIEMFTQMLEEKGVSAFSTWEKELFKIVFDSRYLLLTSKERKQTFDKYTRERVDKERKEKLNRSKKQRQDFREFLREKFKEHKYSTRLTYAEFAKKHSNSEQFKLIEKIREREQLFHEFVDELKKKERDEKQREKDKAKDNFLELLRENQKLFDRHSHFSEMRERFRDDPRYKALQTSQKEDLFRIFISNLPSGSSRHSKRSDSREKHHKSFDKHSSRDRSSSKLKDKLIDKTKNDDSDDSLIIKKKKRPIEELDEGELHSSANESDEEFKLEKDDHIVNENELTEEESKELERKKRIERSLKAREKQVQKEMQGHLQEREKHRNMLKKQELVENFNILLIDLIRNPDMTYREAKKVLKKDHRYDTFESLSRNEKEDLFDAHINNLIKKKRKMFIELLEETKSIKLNSSWRDVRRMIKEDPRYLQLSEKRCEKEFQYFLKEKLMKAKNDFKCLLKETKLISHKSRKLIETTDQQHLADIIVYLQNDKRYLDLDLIEDERRQLIIDYIEHLAKQGTPPPVTSSAGRK